ncbi:chloride channel protein [Anaerobranca gottschalkii]|uniref:Chloride channel protein, CIC family n=1 Tax=Anaerobranca gottschalkii DSM 13577 TaxID=1120990 RepID=A0A1H9YIT0_9FIRM|nr:chloride channel protein [Anaerobranca gottschalkii]SES68970.1 chloride channel protein, CIC family [Anaerobranca gottschalkii DSM 13577]
MPKGILGVGGYMFKWLVIATLSGIGGGLSAFILRRSIDFFSYISRIFPLYLTPLIAGFILIPIYYWDKRAKGFGTDHYILTVNGDEREFKVRTYFSKILATAVTLGFNGSGGVEGPMLVIGGSLDNILRKISAIKITEKDHRLLSICGAAGAIGAMFRSPLGGGIFVVEVLYKSSLPYHDIFPAILSSTMGYVVFSMLGYGNPLFEIPLYIPNMTNVPLFIIAAIISGFLAVFFMYFFAKVEYILKKIPNKIFHPIFGGFLVGGILYFLPQVGGTGLDIIQSMITDTFPLKIAVILLVGKIIATSITVNSGGSAGLVIPALFIGGIGGNFVATVLGVEDLGLIASLVTAGMGASLAGIANVPVAAAVMIVEMVGLKIGVPAVLGSIIGYAIGRRRVIYGFAIPDGEEYELNESLRLLDRNEEKH